MGSTAFSAIAAGMLALSFSGVSGPFSLQSESAVRVDLASLTWWSGSSVGLGQVDAVPLLNVSQPELPLIEAREIQKAQAQAAAKARLRLRVLKKVAVAHRLKPATKAKPVVRAVSVSATTSDSIVLKSAAPRVIAPNAESIPQNEGSASESEIQSLRGAHLSLRTQFQLALTTQSPPVLVAAVATQPVRRPAAVEVAPLEKLKRPARVLQRKKKASQRRISVIPKTLKVAATPIATPQVVVPAPVSLPEPAIFQGSSQQIRQAHENTARDTTTDQVAATQSAPEEIVSATAATQEVSTQPETAVAQATDSAPLQEKSGTREAVEAFDWSTTIHAPNSQVISHEGVVSLQQSRWERWSAEAHWPSLYWSSIATPLQSVPLISSNTARLLATLAGVPLQEGAGIVFGKVPAGWTVEFSGRAERPLFFAQDRSALPASKTDQNRYFAFINVAPGAHIASLVRADGAVRAGIALPVAEGSATHIDLSTVAARDISGRVLDASSKDAAPLSSVNVRVIGQTGKLTVTDKTGRFSIRDVATIGDHPVYLETMDRTGYTHRYRTTPGSPNILFRFSDKAVAHWLQQLEGGISAESGLAVAAMPEIVASQEKGSLFAQTQPLLSNTTLRPETYTLSAEDRLMASAPLEALPPRFVSVQIPEGANISELHNKSKTIAWSEMIFSSPGVINVIGPY
jgi:hypothetical protein